MVVESAYVAPPDLENFHLNLASKESSLRVTCLWIWRWTISNTLSSSVFKKSIVQRSVNPPGRQTT
jgi:hypothetical protein